MATLLTDQELRKLFGTVIINAVDECVRPSSYIIRLGGPGEFINTRKEFALKPGKGLDLHAGHSVGVTSLETIDFGKEAVDKIYPGCNLHGFLSPTTDLSREGLVVSSTHVDPGYHGTLNWTINNHSSTQAKFIYGEKLFRLTVFRLEHDENPQSLYDGDYQGKTGYVRSERRGAPVGMKDSDWINPLVSDSPENKIEELIKSGYPWNLLGQQFKQIDDQFKTVTNEYSEIRDAIENLQREIGQINDKMSKQVPITKQDMDKLVVEVKEDVDKLVEGRYKDFFLKVYGSLAGLIGIGLIILTNDKAKDFIYEHGVIIGLLLIVLSIATSLLLRKP